MIWTDQSRPPHLSHPTHTQTQAPAVNCESLGRPLFAPCFPAQEKKTFWGFLLRYLQLSDKGDLRSGSSAECYIPEKAHGQKKRTPIA